MTILIPILWSEFWILFLQLQILNFFRGTGNCRQIYITFYLLPLRSCQWSFGELHRWRDGRAALDVLPAHSAVDTVLFVSDR